MYKSARLRIISIPFVMIMCAWHYIRWLKRRLRRHRIRLHLIFDIISGFTMPFYRNCMRHQQNIFDRYASYTVRGSK